MTNDYFNKLVKAFYKVNQDDITSLSNLLYPCDSAVFVFGNGGSAATAAHFVQDMNKTLGYNFICLNDNIPTMLAYGNDCGFDTIFRQQLEKLAKPTDKVIGISCSGNSKNVIEAINYANALRCITVGFTGFDGGVLKELVKYNIHVPCDDMQICEDIHLIITHILLKLKNKDHAGTGL